jgi:hypothetical protein
MADEKSYPNVGAPDPELENSPIADESYEESEDLKQEMPGEPVCLFNGVTYPHGDFVQSGGSLLRCDYGIWVPSGPVDADNP